MSHTCEPATKVTCAAKPAVFLDAVLDQCRAHDHYPFDQLPGQLLDLEWADPIITLARYLPQDAEAIEVLEDLKKALSAFTFLCPSCGVRCPILHFLNKIRPLAAELAKQPAAANLELVSEHQNEATLRSALQALANGLTEEVLAKYGSLRRGVYHLQYQVAKAHDGRRLLFLTLDRFRPEQETLRFHQRERRAYRCGRVTASGVEYLRNQSYIGGSQIWILDEALEQLEQELGCAFRGPGIPATLLHMTLSSLDVENFYDSEDIHDKDPDDDHDPILVADLAVGGIKLGHFLAWTEFADRVVLYTYRPYEFDGEIDPRELDLEDHEFGSVLRKLLTLDELPEVNEVPGLSDEMLANAFALATALRSGQARPYDIAALREFLRRTADTASAPVDSELLKRFLPQPAAATTEPTGPGEATPASALNAEPAKSSLGRGDRGWASTVAKPTPR